MDGSLAHVKKKIRRLLPDAFAEYDGNDDGYIHSTMHLAKTANPSEDPLGEVLDHFRPEVFLRLTKADWG